MPSVQQGAVREEAGERPLIVVVDGEGLYRWFARECLRDAGYRVVLFARASDLLAYLKHHHAAVALVDAQTLDDEKIDSRSVRVEGGSVIVLGSEDTSHTHGHLECCMAPKPSDRESLLALVRSADGHKPPRGSR